MGGRCEMLVVLLPAGKPCTRNWLTKFSVRAVPRRGPAEDLRMCWTCITAVKDIAQSTAAQRQQDAQLLAQHTRLVEASPSTWDGCLHTGSSAGPCI